MHMGRLQQEFTTGEMGFERHIAGQQAGEPTLEEAHSSRFRQDPPASALRLIAVAAGSTV
jgi:hypothetical protein